MSVDVCFPDVREERILERQLGHGSLGEVRDERKYRFRDFVSSCVLGRGG